ncbi:centrin-1-like [Rhodnius prolixus]|uniref:centrin-1-like n=1 Tax=Rhodnius prolixus TaxID=13249 RepID=UPI003D18861C
MHAEGGGQKKPGVSKVKQASWQPKTSSGPKYKLLDKHKEELYQIFDMLDDGSGSIKVKDIQSVFKAMNFTVDEAEMKRLFKGIKSDKITADTLVTIMENKLAEDETKSDLKRIFGAFDYDNKGFITVSNLKKLADSLELEITDDELQEMIDEADLNQDGVVNEDEFIEIMLKVDL